MKKPRGILRTGYTTGTCAAAAAKGAALMLTGRREPVIDVTLPGGETARLPAASMDYQGDAAFCEIVKDAGDDPDSTNGAHIKATVTYILSGEIILRGGHGVGLVTRPGLAVPPGKPAINPVPEKMIRSSIQEVLAPSQGAEITLSVADGVELAKKTLNPRLGIVGGISILGTTGLVIPYSHEAYQESIRCALDVLRAMGIDRAVFCTGRSSEQEAQKNIFSLPEAAFILMGDYFSFIVEEAVRHEIKHIIIAGFPGKILKMAMGAACTHYRKSSIDLIFLADLAKKNGIPESIVGQIEHAHTARHAMGFIPEKYQYSLFSRIADMIEVHIQSIAGTYLKTEILLLAYDGKVIFHKG